MYRNLFLPVLAIVAFACSANQVHQVQAGGCLKEAKHKVCCPQCACKSSCCTLEAEMVDVEKKCFEVECKTICIPKVVFPWQKKKHGCHSCDGRGCTNCVHNGAKIRKIKVLKSKKYTCPECEYTWTPKEGASCCGKGSGCGCGSCDSGCSAGCDAGCDVGMIYQDVPAPATYQPTEAMQYDSPYAPASDSMHHEEETVVPTAPEPGQMFAPVDVQVP